MEKGEAQSKTGRGGGHEDKRMSMGVRRRRGKWQFGHQSGRGGDWV